tara:strand:- start:1317 stop:1829 length:513 start_codon:yes stop_codon:yes gene_type:complete
MNYNQIITENIKIDDKCNITYKTSKNNIRKLTIRTPPLYLPFGIDKHENNLYLNVQLRKNKDPKHNTELGLFEKCIQNIETLFKERLGMNVNSQIRYKDGYDPIISFKVLKNKNKIITEVKQGNSFYNFYNIKKQFVIVSDIIIDRLWIVNNIIYYKIKLNKIDIAFNKT